MNTRRPKSIVLFATITLTIFFVVTVILSGIDDGSMEILRYDDDAVEKRRINQDFRKCVTILNDSGGPWEHVDSLLRRLDEEVFEDPSLAVSIRDRMNREVENIKTHVQPWTPKDKIHRRKSVITVATIICGQSRRGQVINMLKSLLIFSMDATLHLVVFSDASTIVDAAQDVLSLRMAVQERFGSDFTFEIHLDQFPDNGGVPWKKMYRLCATQRLFFADLLPHIDSLIYIDTDMLVLSNITDVWDHFKNHMVEKEFAASAMNNEDAAIGWYGPWLRIPYYGKRGINAGIMLMNLTRMRYFGFGQTSIAVQELYKSRILLADQDIANIIFATYPEYFSVLPCSFNFNWIHCGSNTYNCYNSMGENFCFCRAAVKDGIKIIHGNSNTFRSSYEGHSFLPQMYDAFNWFNMVKDNPRQLIISLIHLFDQSERKPCAPLSSYTLYKNAIKYLDNILA